MAVNRDIAIRMDFHIEDAEFLSTLWKRLPADVVEGLKDQLWLRAILCEQLKRHPVADRARFTKRCDKLLALLDARPDEDES